MLTLRERNIFSKEKVIYSVKYIHAKIYYTHFKIFVCIHTTLSSEELRNIIVYNYFLSSVSGGF